MTIRTKQHEILDLRVAALLRAVNDVVEFSLAFLRDFQADGERLARGSTSIRFFCRQIAVRIAALVQAFSSVSACPFGDALFHRFVVTLFFWSEVAIGLAFFEQAVRSGAVLRRVCRLE